MKSISVILFFLLSVFAQAGEQSLTSKSNGVLSWPTNFWPVNRTNMFPIIPGTNTWVETNALTYRVSMIPFFSYTNITNFPPIFWAASGADIYNTNAGNVNIQNSLYVTNTVNTVNLITKSPWVDVTAFGAVGDGLTDCYIAFTNALDYISGTGGTIFVPPGNYRLTNTFDMTTVNLSVHLKGAGMWATVITTTVTNTPGIIATSSHNKLNHLSDFSLYQSFLSLVPQYRSGNFGIRSLDGIEYGLDIERVQVSFFGDAGIFLTGPCGPTSIKDCSLQYNAHYGLYIGNTFGSTVDIRMEGGNIQKCYGGILLSNAFSFHGQDVDAEANSEYPQLYVTANSYGNTFTDCSFGVAVGDTPNPAGCVVIEDSAGIVIMGGANQVHEPSAIDNIYLTGSGTDHNTVIGGMYSQASSAGTTGYFLRAGGGINTAVFHPMVVSATYQAGKDVVYDVEANFTTAIGVKTVARSIPDKNSISTPALYSDTITTTGKGAIATNITDVAFEIFGTNRATSFDGWGVTSGTNPGHIHTLSYTNITNFPAIYWAGSGTNIYKTNSGNVGIGTSSATELLHLYKTGSGPNLKLDSTLDDGSDYMGGITFGLSGTDVGYIKIKEHTVDAYGFDFATFGALGLTDKLRIRGDGSLEVIKDLRLMGSTSGYVGFAAQSTAGSTTYVWPNSDGNNAYVLQTDGAGNLSWTPIIGLATNAVGLVSLNGDTNSAQSIVAGAGLGLVDAGAAHTFSVVAPTPWAILSTNIYNTNSGNVVIGATAGTNKLTVHQAYSKPGPFLALDATLDDGSDYMGGLIFGLNGDTVSAIQVKEHSLDNYGFDFRTFGTLGMATTMTLYGNGNLEVLGTNIAASFSGWGVTSGVNPGHTHTVYQPATLNLTNWSTIPTNYVPLFADNATNVLNAILTNQTYVTNLIGNLPSVAAGTNTTVATNGVVYTVGTHPPVTLTAEVDNVFTLTSQLLGFENQTAHYAFLGPLSGVPGLPTFRVIDPTDIPVHDQNWTTITNPPTIYTTEAGTNITIVTNLSLLTISTHPELNLDDDVSTIFNVNVGQVFTLAPQDAHKVLIGPTTGSAVPTMRLLVASDIPVVDEATHATNANNAVYVTSGVLTNQTYYTNLLGAPSLHDPVSYTTEAADFLTLGGQQIGLQVQTERYFFAAPVSGGTGLPGFRAIDAGDVPTLNQNTTGSAQYVTTATLTNQVNGTNVIGYVSNAVFATSSSSSYSSTVAQYVVSAILTNQYYSTNMIGHDALSNLTDVTIGTPGTSQAIIYNTGKWRNIDLQLGLNTDVYIDDPANGDVLSYNSDSNRWLNVPYVLQASHATNADTSTYVTTATLTNQVNGTNVLGYVTNATFATSSSSSYSSTVAQYVTSTILTNQYYASNMIGTAASVAPGSNVTVATNGTIYTVSASSPGSVAAGSNITVATNGSIYTVSASSGMIGGTFTSFTMDGGTTNNLARGSVLRIKLTGVGGGTITGMDAGSPGDIVIIYNGTDGGSVAITGQSSSSLEANRFGGSSGFGVGAWQMYLYMDGRWHLYGQNNT